MAWPSTLTTTALDSDTDIVKDARPQLLAGLQATNSIINSRGQADGVASLGAGGQIPSAQIPNTLTSTGSLNINLTPASNKVAITNTINLSPLTSTQIAAKSNAAAGDIVYSTNSDDGNPCIAVHNGVEWKTIPLDQISDIVDDTTPQLGGDLDVNSRKIVSTSNGDITLEPNGTGQVVVSGTLEVDGAITINNSVNATGQTVSDAKLKGYAETVYTSLATSGTLEPDPANGNVQDITLSGNITINNLGGTPAAGDSVTIIIRQPIGNVYSLSSTMLFSGGNNVLSNTSDSIDVLHIFYTGSEYLATLINGYQ
jgi:hypothetical protein